MQTFGIKLPSRKAVNDNSAIKSVALVTFRFLRASTQCVTATPNALRRMGLDVSDAWRESAVHATPKP